MSQPYLFLFFFLALLHPLTSLYTSRDVSRHKSLYESLYGKNAASPSGLSIQNSCNEFSLVNASALTDTIMLSGYMQVSATPGSALWYAFIGKEGVKSTADLYKYPLLIWLNGGPGASSTDGLFFENGPFVLTVLQDGSIIETKRNIAWTSNYSVLFIDQPVGTGNSYAASPNDYVTTEDQVAQQFYYALQQLPSMSGASCNFFETYFNNTTPVYLTGESYAGKYIPSIASHIIEQNKLSTTSRKLNLKGIAIGDGFTSPQDIVSEYAAFAFNLGLIDYEERMVEERTLLANIIASQNQNWDIAWSAWDTAIFDIQNKGGQFYMYDIFEYEAPVDFGNTARFFAQPGVAAKYNVFNGVLFGSQADQVYMHLMSDMMQTVAPKVLDSINSPIKVLIYNGQDDFIVPNPGTMKWVDKLVWEGSDNFVNQDFQLWKYDRSQTELQGNVCGYYKGFYNNNKWVELRIVNKAGHFVPYYQPEYALQMINQFVEGTPGKWPDYMVENFSP